MSKESDIIEAIKALSRACNTNSVSIIIVCFALLLNVVLDLIILFRM